MRNVILVMVVSFSLSSCLYVSVISHRIGGLSDKYGCIPSAGMTYSQLKGECIQVFNQGLRLNPIQVNENEAVISAFILFSKNGKRVEVFLPNNKSVILDAKDDVIFEKDNVKYDKNSRTLYIDGILRYKQEK